MFYPQEPPPEPPPPPPEPPPPSASPTEDCELLGATVTGFGVAGRGAGAAAGLALAVVVVVGFALEASGMVSVLQAERPIAMPSAAQVSVILFIMSTIAIKVKIMARAYRP